MNSMAITAKALAEMLGLSESAVSLALNNKPGVSRETRKRVIDAAGKHGFDFSKRNYSSQKKGTVCFAVYKRSGAVVNDTPFFSSLTDGVSASCRGKNGMDLVFVPDPFDFRLVIRGIPETFRHHDQFGMLDG